LTTQHHGRILITGIPLRCHLGITAGERQLDQPISVDVQLDINLTQAAASDNLADTVDYSAVRAALEQVAGAKHYDLVEHLASRMIDAVLAGFPTVLGMELTVWKPEALRQFGVRNTAIQLTGRRA
jgi:7,8-dihydroneopterin aldolase/epimerase/oxygenase